MVDPTDKKPNLLELLAGLKALFELPETGKHDPYEPELYGFIPTAYNFNAILGKRVMWEEGMCDPTFQETNLTGHKSKSVEIFAGCGLKIMVLKMFKWENSIGLGGYRSLNFPDKMNLNYGKQNLGPTQVKNKRTGL